MNIKNTKNYNKSTQDVRHKLTISSLGRCKKYKSVDPGIKLIYASPIFLGQIVLDKT